MGPLAYQFGYQTMCLVSAEDRMADRVLIGPTLI